MAIALGTRHSQAGLGFLPSQRSAFQVWAFGVKPRCEHCHLLLVPQADGGRDCCVPYSGCAADSQNCTEILLMHAVLVASLTVLPYAWACVVCRQSILHD